MGTTEGVTIHNQKTLKPCPFCGETADITKHFKEDMWRLTHRCPVMGAILLGWTFPEQRLIDRWNTRHDT